MSEEITKAFVDQFRANVVHLAQQKVSKLWKYVQLKENVKGKAVFFEQIGRSEMRDVATRHADSPQMDTPHDRRKATMVTSDWGDLIDKSDAIRSLIDPASAYTMSAAMAVGRRKDKHIIDASIGISYSGESGTTQIALPAAQIIAADNVGLTIAKVKQAKEIMDEAEIDDEGRIMLYSSQQFSDLLEDARFTSTDYNTVRALVDGKVDTYLGFKWERIEARKGAPSAGTASGINKHGLPYNATLDVTSCIALSSLRIGLAIGEMETFRVTERADKRFSKYVYAELDMGAIRTEEEGVVRIDCDNSPS